MKTLPRFAKFFTSERPIRTRAIIVTAASLAMTFWFLSNPSAVAGNTCMVCHRRVDTLTLACNSLEYQRHLDHGDPPDACDGTPISKEDGPQRRRRTGPQSSDLLRDTFGIQNAFRSPACAHALGNSKSSRQLLDPVLPTRGRRSGNL